MHICFCHICTSVHSSESSLFNALRDLKMIDLIAMLLYLFLAKLVECTCGVVVCIGTAHKINEQACAGLNQ